MKMVLGQRSLSWFVTAFCFCHKVSRKEIFKWHIISHETLQKQPKDGANNQYVQVHMFKGDVFYETTLFRQAKPQ